jgi:hypothetical protein
MTTLQVFDPAMCCSSGVCGPNVDPVLPKFQEDFHWLANQGIAVERFNLAQQPQAFTTNPVVKAALALEGTKCLPLIVVNGTIVSKGRYPERAELARWAGLEVATGKRSALPVLASGGGCCEPGSGCC